MNSAQAIYHDADVQLIMAAQPELPRFSEARAELAGHDACFYCLGVSSAGMSEPDYRRVTYDLTLSVARTLLATRGMPVSVSLPRAWRITSALRSSSDFITACRSHRRGRQSSSRQE